ncbi:unnamed protein product [Ectocarpus sp. 6 AP-2014]
MLPQRHTRAPWRDEDEGYAPSPGRGRYSLSTLAGSPDAPVVDLAGLDTALRNDDSVVLSPQGDGDDQGSGDTASGQKAGATGNQTAVRPMCRIGEKQLLMQLVQEYTPEGTRETKARARVWLDLAKRMLIPTEVTVTEDAEDIVVTVDYQRGRDTVAMDKLVDTCQRLVRDAKKKIEKEQRDAPKKTGEGTVDPEEPSEEAMKSSLEHHTALAVQYDLYAKEQSMSKGKVAKEHAEWAGSTRNSNTEDIFSLRGGRGGGGRGGGGRGGGGRAAGGRGAGARGAGARGAGARGAGARGAGARGAGARGAGARGAGGASAGGRGAGARGTGGASAGGRGAGARGAGGASGGGRGGMSSTGGRPGGRGSRGASNHRRPGGEEDWETAEFFAPRRGALEAAAAGELTVDLLPEEGDWEEEVDLAAADDQEAQMLSGGKLGRQYRDGANGSARKQVFRGNPEAANASVGEQIAAGFDFLFRRDEREEQRLREEREERAARLAAGGAGGDAASARLDRMEAKVEDQNGKLDKLLELVGRSNGMQQPAPQFGVAGFHSAMYPGPVGPWPPQSSGTGLDGGGGSSGWIHGAAGAPRTAPPPSTTAGGQAELPGFLSAERGAGNRPAERGGASAGSVGDGGARASGQGAMAPTQSSAIRVSRKRVGGASGAQTSTGGVAGFGRTAAKRSRGGSIRDAGT